MEVFALIVTYTTYVVETVNPREKYEGSVVDVLHCLQIVRVFRLFRVVRNFVGFRALLHAFKASILEVLLKMWFLLVAMLFFSALAFFSEDHTFHSIPDAFWWVVVCVCRRQGRRCVGHICLDIGLRHVFPARDLRLWLRHISCGRLLKCIMYCR